VPIPSRIGLQSGTDTGRTPEKLRSTSGKMLPKLTKGERTIAKTTKVDKT